VALLHIKQEFDSRRTAETRSFGVVDRDHALVLDVHLGEDGYKVRDKNIQLNSNIIRKHVINSIRTRIAGLNVKRPISRLLFDNLLDPTNIIPFLKPK
jgi:hypothetical protein